MSFKDQFKKLVEFDYRTATTRRLRDTLRLVRTIEQRNGVYGDGYWGEWNEVTSDIDDLLIKNVVIALKSELANRPNVPNKKQRKEERRLNAQKK